MTRDEAPLRWRKTRQSGGNGGQCVELAHTRKAVRDSKHPTGPVLHVDLGRFLRELEAGRFDR